MDTSRCVFRNPEQALAYRSQLGTQFGSRGAASGGG